MSDLSGNWTAWQCADCSPDPLFGDDRYERPYVMLLPEGVVGPETCPRCDGWRGISQEVTELRITNTPAERWAARRKTKGEAAEA